jgi:general stress protein 26
MKLSEHQRLILKQRRIASVATIDPEGFPHLTAVWFHFDGDSLSLAIPSKSVKYRNLKLNKKLSIMIDTRDTGSETGISMSGIAEILMGQEAQVAIKTIHSKYITKEGIEEPSVGPLFASFDDVAVKLKPEKIISWDMSALDQQIFNGKLSKLSLLYPTER